MPASTAARNAKFRRSLYPIGRELGILALRTVRHVPASTLDRLEAINERFGAARTRAEPQAARDAGPGSSARWPATNARNWETRTTSRGRRASTWS
jgi:hypothetical protein